MMLYRVVLLIETDSEDTFRTALEDIVDNKPEGVKDITCVGINMATVESVPLN
jgi:hypothetical protein